MKWPMDLSWVDEFIEDHNQRVYGGLMSPRAKAVLRSMKMKEHEFWLAQESRQDSNSASCWTASAQRRVYPYRIHKTRGTYRTNIAFRQRRPEITGGPPSGNGRLNV
jgi:hypothetical protein